MDQEEMEIHLILIGHTGVGKTSLRKHLKNMPIDTQEAPTLIMESDYMHKEIPLQSSGNRLSLTMWDTGGQPIFQDLLPCFARFRCMYSLVFRLPDIVSFDCCPEIRPYSKHSKPVQSLFTNREIIYRNLAFIQAFSSSFQEKPGDKASSFGFPAAIVVGTCYDKLPSYHEDLVE